MFRTTGRFLLLLALPLLMTPAIAEDPSKSNKKQAVIKLATTTSTDNSGLLDYLLPSFKKQTGYEVHVIAVGTGKALRIGCDGDADVVLVHAPKAEKAFVEKACGEKRNAVMYNDFVVVGPDSDPAGLESATTVNDAMKNIVKTQSLFVSRGDDSGTHKKELSLWKAAGAEAAGKWYREAGQGMGKVLQMAGEMDAYTLTDRGTWLAYKAKSPLKIRFEGDRVLQNPYSIIAVSKEKYTDINYVGAMALINWIRAEQAQDLIAEFKIENTRLFTPSAHPARKNALRTSVKK